MAWELAIRDGSGEDVFQACSATGRGVAVGCCGGVPAASADDPLDLCEVVAVHDPELGLVG